MKRIRVIPKIHGFPTPTALRHSAQGCEGRATLGQPDHFFLPQRGCVNRRRADGCNPVEVVSVLRGLPKVAPRTAQPWAGGRNPLGILQPSHAMNGGAK